MIKALQPFYNRIYIKLDYTCTEDVYEFLYKTSIKNDYTTVVLNKFNKKFIDEIKLFKNINIQIEVTSDKEIVDYDGCSYFCNLKYYKDIDYRPIGVYQDFNEEYVYNKDIIQYNIDETIVKNNLDTIIKNLTSSPELDPYQGLILSKIKPVLSGVNTVIDLYLLQNMNSIYLDSKGNFYKDITYTNQLGNIMTDNIELSLFRSIERG